jgi:hypothetical protein
MISERTLKNWRKDALKTERILEWDAASPKLVKELSSRILLLTQELMDLHLIRKEN